MSTKVKTLLLVFVILDYQMVHFKKRDSSQHTCRIADLTLSMLRFLASCSNVSSSTDRRFTLLAHNSNITISGCVAAIVFKDNY